MKFVNKTGEDKKIRIDNKHPFPPDWKMVKNGTEVDLPEHYGNNLGFTPIKAKKPVSDKPEEKKADSKKEVKAKESKAGSTKIETKEIEKTESKKTPEKK